MKSINDNSRRLTLVGRDDVRQEPAGDIESLRYAKREVKPIILTANKEVVLQNIKGRCNGNKS